MKNWSTLESDKYCLVGPHRFTKGRTRPIDRIVIHHNAAVRWTTERVRDLWNNEREASAHYQVEGDGTIGQIVNDWDTAWHAANADINARSIGIEHANISGPPRWQISDATIEEGAHLTAALCRAYKLGRPEWGKNVFPHSQFTSTSCPHQLDRGGEDHDTYMRRAQYWYDNPKGAPTAPPQKKENPMSLFGPDQVGALHEAKVNSAAASEKLDEVLTALAEIERRVRLVEDQLLGPEQSSWPVELRNPHGGRGWPQLGVNARGQWLTVVDFLRTLGRKVEK